MTLHSYFIIIKFLQYWPEVKPNHLVKIVKIAHTMDQTIWLKNKWPKNCCNSTSWEFFFQKSESLSQSIEMLTGTLDFLDEKIREGSEWSKELGTIEVEYFLNLQNSDHKFHALNFVAKVIPRLAESANWQLLENFCDSVAGILEQSSSVSCREKSIDILRWIFDATKPPFPPNGDGCHERLFNKSRIALVKGNFVTTTK